MSLLLECHQRIRDFGALTLVIAKSPHVAAEVIAEASLRVQRYFGEALPLHVQDEEQSIAPRLMGFDNAVDRALGEMKAQHGEHEALLRELRGLCAQLGSHPEQLPMYQSRLHSVGELLTKDFGNHLSLEETLIFPAIERYLVKDTQSMIVREMRARRGAPLGE